MSDELDPRVVAIAQSRCLPPRGAFGHFDEWGAIERGVKIADASDAARGIVRVPLVPTHDMLAATYHPTLGLNNPIYAAIWRAMCAAAAPDAASDAENDRVQLTFARRGAAELRAALGMPPDAPWPDVLAEVGRLRAINTAGHALYWDENDPEGSAADPSDIMDNYSMGEVVPIREGRALWTRYYVHAWNADESEVLHADFDTIEEAQRWVNERDAERAAYEARGEAEAPG